MMPPRIKSEIQVKAIIRRAEVAGAQAFLVRRGQEDAGALFLKVSRLDGTITVLNQARRGNGELIWTKPLGESADEAAVTAYLDKQLRFDPDLWILEIEDRDGRAFVDEPVV
ncbi:MAG: DUF1491 family protein [Alphaproteobacteria bacterium]|nr:DUF1491 family protein [Alphaproteobacteria bacterium]MBV9062868.1 DUF1491 family protein [Alphaproteobacteria bacterium]